MTFAPRCLVAKNGWIACGGENGEFVAFPVQEDGEISGGSGSGSSSSTTRTPSSNLRDDPSFTYIRNYIENGGTRSDMLEIFGDQLSADDRLQLGLELDPSAAAAATSGQTDSNELPPFLNSSGARTRSESNNNKSLVARSKSFGKDRVNCITLWFPPTSSHNDVIQTGAYSQAVAVLANNDKKVTVVNLEFQDAVEEVEYPDCVNRALISPDGRLLVAICDDPYLYVHERAPKAGVTPSLFGRRDTEDFEWGQCAKVHLVSQRKDDRSDQRGSFAACFSNTGRYLAVGTQYGTISVFDTAALVEPGLDPLITSFTSSRPREDVGAIRDMAFCPGPYDLLAWTEHRGRVGIVDIRSNYVSRQILDLGNYDDYEQIIVTERGSIDPRLLSRNSRGDLTLADSASEGITNRRARRGFGSDFHAPLSADETSVLDALSEHRRRREQVAARNASSSGPASMRLLDRLHNRTAVTTREGPVFRGDHRNNSSRVSDILEEIHSQRERLRLQTEQLRQHSDLLNVRQQGLLSLEEPYMTTLERRSNNIDRAVERSVAARTPVRSRPNRPAPPNPPQIDAAVLPNNFADILADFVHSTDQQAPHQNTFEAYVLATDLANNRGDASGGDNNTTSNNNNNNNNNNGTNIERPTDRAHLASVWSTLLRQRDGDTDAPGSRIARARAQMNMVGRVDREHDDTAGLAWSEDGRVL